MSSVVFDPLSDGFFEFSVLIDKKSRNLSFERVASDNIFFFLESQNI